MILILHTITIYIVVPKNVPKFYARNRQKDSITYINVNYSKIWSVGDNFVMKQRLKETVGLAGESSNTPPLNQQVLLTTSEESMTSGTVREGVLECLC